MHIKKNIIKENDIILKIALIIVSICFAVPSILFFIRNKTIYNFNGDLEYCFLLTRDINRLYQAGVFCIFVTIYLLIYFLLIKNRDKIFKNTKQVYMFVFIISVIFLVALPFWCSDIFYYLGIGRLNSTYHQNPYYVTMKDFYESNLANQNDTVILKGYNNYWSNTTVVYGALWTFICSIVSFLSFGNIDIGVLVFKIINLGIHIANCCLLFKLTKNKLFPLLYGLNPFILIEGISNVHNDMFVLFFILMALYFLVENKKTISSVLFLAMATCIKYIAILFLPLFIIYNYRDKCVKTRFFKCLEYGILFIVFCSIPYLLYTKDINVFIGLITQQDKIAKGLYLFINEYFNNPKNIVQIVKNISLLVFSTLYICMCISLLFKKEIVLKKEMNKLFWFLVAFIFLLITNFQPWYLIWLTVFISYVEKENIKLIIQMQNMTLMANIVFLIYSENYKYGVPFFFILIAGILTCIILNKNEIIKKYRKMTNKGTATSSTIGQKGEIP